MRGKLFAVLMGASLVLAACGGNEDSTEDTASAGDPEKIYTQKCSQCHGVELEGKGKNFPDISTVGARLSEEEIEKTILEGKGAMPPKLIEGETAAAVAEWLAAKK